MLGWQLGLPARAISSSTFDSFIQLIILDKKYECKSEIDFLDLLSFGLVNLLVLESFSLDGFSLGLALLVQGDC